MIKKEVYKIREDGAVLYRTFSDTDHKVRNKRTSAIYVEAVDIAKDEEYEEAEDYIELEGSDTYEEILKESENAKLVARKINRIGLSDNESLSVKEMFPRWEDMIDKTIESGFVVYHKNNLWRARQTHTAHNEYAPSFDTASLWEIIVKEHSGGYDDPIPYTPPMEIFGGKYYTQEGVIYICTRDSDIPLTHALKDLINISVDVVV
jgi:hypothetical protein